MSFMHAMVPDVVAVVEDRAALSGEGYCVRDASFGQVPYRRMDFENGDWYQGDWCKGGLQGTGCFYHKKTNFGYQGAFEKNCSVQGTYYFGGLENCEHKLYKKEIVHVLRERSWEAVNVLQDSFWESLSKL
jgi:hypothetical protein